MRNYDAEISAEGTPLTREAVEGKSISFSEGRCMADPQDPSNANRRNPKWYLENVIDIGISAGKIGDGIKSKFDDRKPRLDIISLKPEKLEVSVGMTYFGENKESISRGEKNPAEAERLHSLGMEMYGDKYAFFARAPGVSGAIISSDGEMILGTRLQQDGRGLLHPAGGYIEYKKDLRNLNLNEEVIREVEEEFGVSEKCIMNKRLVGIYSNPLTGEADFTYHIFTNIPTVHFTSGEFKKDRKDEEHGEIVVVNKISQAHKILQYGGVVTGSGEKFGLMYTARGALEALRNGDLAS